MLIKVNPNRMELLRLRKRLALARRGHKLLKNKEEELMKRFTEMMEKEREMRREMEENLATLYNSLLHAIGVLDEKVFLSAITLTEAKSSIEVSTRMVVNLRLPQFELKLDGDLRSTGFACTSCDLDSVLTTLAKTFPLMVELAGLEKSILLLSRELETTRRRVNALEHILIPTLEGTISHIDARLDEMERETTTRLMKVKEMLESA